MYQRSTPSPSTSSPSDGTATFAYGPLGRIAIQVDSDGTRTQTWSYNGPTVTSTDENGNQWLRTSDTLGRPKKVLEPNGVRQMASMETDYGYNALDDLISVSQSVGRAWTSYL